MIKCSKKYNNAATAQDHWQCCVPSRVYSHKSWCLTAGAEAEETRLLVSSNLTVKYQSHISHEHGEEHRHIKLGWSRKRVMPTNLPVQH